MQAAAAASPLDDAVATTAKRLGISHRMARTDVVTVALSLYRKGLLWPAGVSTVAD